MFSRRPDLRGWLELDDPMQIVRMKVVRSLEKDRPAGLKPFYGRIAHIVRGAIVDQRRKHFGAHGPARNGRRFTDINAGVSESDGGFDPVCPRADCPADLELWGMLHEAIEGLDEPYRYAVNFKLYGESSTAEIAEILGVDESTARRYWVTARV